jgi:DNA-directed RNA polymerase specialized sigma24 family protein
MAIVLRRYDDISYEEIGEILDLSVPAVKSVIFRRADRAASKAATLSRGMTPPDSRHKRGRFRHSAQ